MTAIASATHRPSFDLVVPDRVPDELRRGVQAVGGAARGFAKFGSGPLSDVTKGAPFKFGAVPGAAIVTSAFAAYDTAREYDRSGLSVETARVGARGVGGVAGSFSGGALGARLGSIGGTRFAVLGGALGAVTGGFAGGVVGQGLVDAVDAISPW